MSTPLRTRFAPSPTGSLHVGGVRTALYCLLEARRTGGTYVLRIEDTDRARSSEEAAQGIVDDFGWLGLQWDEGPGIGGPHAPYRQSERLAQYTAHAERLIEEGKAYHAWETSEELAAERKEAEAAKRDYRYRERPYSPEDLQRFREEGRRPVLRFRAPRREVTVLDRIRGAVTVDAGSVDDFVILKADGWPTYHFAVVIDDHFMEIDLVLRGAEHMMNAHKHVLLYEAFGWEPPAHGHLPLIANPSGAKMGKRDKAKAAREAARQAHKEQGLPKGEYGWLAARTRLSEADIGAFMAKKSDAVPVAAAVAEALGVDLPMVEVLDFRRAGYLPEALVNFLALLGWSPGDDREILTMEELVEAFDVARVNKAPAKFDVEKLAWMNAQHMQSLPTERLLECLAQWLAVVDSPLGPLDEAQRRALLEMYRPRARTFRDIETLGHFFFAAPAGWDAKAVKKHLDKGDGWSRLEQARGALDDVGRWEAPSLLKAFEALTEATGVPVGKYAQPVRVAVTGTGVSPEIFDTLAFLGREETLARIAGLVAQRPSED